MNSSSITHTGRSLRHFPHSLKNAFCVLGILLACGLSSQSRAQITLPTPIVRETFESTAEGSLPAGWSVQNFTDDNTPGDDLDALR